MVASENGHSFLEPDFESDQQGHCLNAIVASIDVIAHEEIVRLWDLSSDSEQLHQIVELTMDVTTDCHWHWNSSYVCLLTENLFSLKC